jgi:hypothetical protein
MLDGFRDRGTTAVRDVTEKREFLFAYRCLSHA